MTGGKKAIKVDIQKSAKLLAEWQAEGTRIEAEQAATHASNRRSCSLDPTILDDHC